MIGNGSHTGQLTDMAEQVISQWIQSYANACHFNAHAHGWWDDRDRNFGEVISLMHSELSEALEAYRDGDDMTKISYEHREAAGMTVNNDVRGFRGELGKPVGVASEFADVIIRIFDTCVALDIPIVQALIEKHRYNLTRPYRHGGKLA